MKMSRQYFDINGIPIIERSIVRYYCPYGEVKDYIVYYNYTYESWQLWRLYPESGQRGIHATGLCAFHWDINSHLLEVIGSYIGVIPADPYLQSLENNNL